MTAGRGARADSRELAKQVSGPAGATEGCPLPFLTPEQVAERYGVGVGRVIGWIRRGELTGLNLSGSPRSKRPQYRISAEALDKFEAGRIAGPRTVKRRTGYVPQLV